MLRVHTQRAAPGIRRTDVRNVRPGACHARTTEGRSRTEPRPAARSKDRAARPGPDRHRASGVTRHCRCKGEPEGQSPGRFRTRPCRKHGAAGVLHENAQRKLRRTIPHRIPPDTDIPKDIRSGPDRQCPSVPLHSFVAAARSGICHRVQGDACRGPSEEGAQQVNRTSKRIPESVADSQS